MALLGSILRCIVAIGPKLKQNHLWQRMVKHTIAITITISIVIIPAVNALYGPAAYLAAMTTVFSHCAQRFGQMVQSLIFVLAGMFLGLGWATLALYLSGLVFETSQPGAYTIRAIFLVVVTLAHGYVRSYSPRLFLPVWITLLTSFTILVGTTNQVRLATLTNIVYPILTAMAVLLIVNVTVFPEFSARFLADTTIQALSQTQKTLKAATELFMEPSGEEGTTAQGPSRSNSLSQGENSRSESSAEKPEKTPSKVSRLASLTTEKAKLRAKLSSCTSALQECAFEIEYAVLPSRSLKPICSTAMAGLVRNVITLISACESKFVLMGGEEMSAKKSGVSTGTSTEAESERPDDVDGDNGGRSETGKQIPASRRTSVESRLEHIKPQRQVASGDPEVLEILLTGVREPVSDLLAQVDGAIHLVTACLAYCYDIEKPPAGIIVPKGITIEELDIRVDNFAEAVAYFDTCFQESLSRVAVVEAAHDEVWVMPRIETFLLASSLLSLRNSAEQVMQMLKYARTLVGRRQARRDRRRLYWPRKINWRKWLRTGGEQDATALPESARKEVRTGKDPNPSANNEGEAGHSEFEGDEDINPPKRDEEADPPHCEAREPAPTPPSPEKASHMTSSESKTGRTTKYSSLWWRSHAANILKSLGHSEHLGYAIKLTVAVMLVGWIPFYGPLNNWYNSARAIWAPLQLVLVFEVAIGSSLWVFFVRAFGVVAGCVWGYLAYEIGRGNLVALVVLLVLGVIPSAYVQLGTPYVKAGMISIVSMCIVAISTASTSGPAWETFVKRLVAFLVGGTVALIIEVTLYPVRARDRLVESLSSCIGHIARMQGTIATGTESPSKVTELRSAKLNSRFAKAKEKAQNSLSAAETFLPFCLTEPRLKGSFKSLEPIYKEIIYVLHQVIDRMDNSISLRQAYGSSVLEDMNPHVYIYRRNVSAAITVTLFAVNEALTTKMPLPQFLPSCRLAQMRLVNRVREVIQTQHPSVIGDVLASAAANGKGNPADGMTTPTRIHSDMIRHATQQKFLSWSAAAAGQMEIIEYLEELVDLAKLLVGVNAFRSGMLERPSYRNYAQRLRSMDKGKGRARSGLGSTLRPSTFDGATGSETVSDAGIPMTPAVSAPTVRRRRMASTASFIVLQRSMTERLRKRVQSNLEKGTKERNHAVEEEDELPITLQRIGTRFKQENS